MMAGRPGHPAAPARLRSDSDRSPPRPQAVQSPTQALRRGAAGPRSLPTAHRRADGPTPPETKPRQPGRAPAGPGLIAPCPTPGPVLVESAAVVVRQRRAHQLDLLRQVRAGHPSVTLTTRLLAVPSGLPPSSVTEPSASTVRVVGRLLDLLLLPSCDGLAQRRTPRHFPPPPGNAAPTVHCCPQKELV